MFKRKLFSMLMAVALTAAMASTVAAQPVLGGIAGLGLTRQQGEEGAGKPELQALVIDVYAMDAEAYTTASWAQLVLALAAAEDALAGEEAEGAVAAAHAALAAAVQALVEKEPAGSPSATVKEEEKYTRPVLGGYTMISFKLYDADKVAGYQLNEGVYNTLTPNNYSDVNYIKVGGSLKGAVYGLNVLKVFDTKGNVSHHEFILLEKALEPGELEFIAASAPETVYLNQQFAVEALTGQGVSAVALFSESGRELAQTQLYADNEDGTRSWVLMTALNTLGKRNLTIKYAGASGQWLDAGERLALTVEELQEQTSKPVAAKTRASVHDPSIVKDGDTYYIFGSNQGVARSTDLINWSTVRNANLYGATTAEVVANLAGSFAWAGYADGSANAKTGMALWAPDAIYNPHYVNEDGTTGAYLIYYPVCSNHKRGAIGFAVSQNILGPYKYGDTILYSGFTLTGGPDEEGVTVDTHWENTNLPRLIEDGIIEGLRDSWFMEDGSYNISRHAQPIDPSVFFDEDGRLWMVYGGGMLIELDKATGGAIYPGKDGVTEGGNEIDRYFGIRIGGGYYMGGEGAYIEYDEASGYYYLYVTYGQITEGYNMRMFRAENVQGPYLDAKGQSAAFNSASDSPAEYGVKVMGNYRLSCLSQGYRHGGHNSILIEDGQMYNIYHQRFSTGSSYQDRIHQVFLTESGWPVMAVYENAGEKISETGYSLNEIVGYYEFVNHGSLSSPSMLDTLIVHLGEDGTITGDLDGRWSFTAGTYYMNVEINGVAYEGVFYKQQDESGYDTKVMTFTAIGENNECIWGSRLGKISDYDSAAAVAAASAISLPTNTRTNLALPTEGEYGTLIQWISSNAEAISPTGRITRSAENRTVTLTGVFMRGGAVYTKTYNVTVEKTGGADEQFNGTPIYRYSFTTTDGYLTTNLGSYTGIGVLYGGAKVIQDVDKGMALSVDNTLQKGSYLRLSSDSLKGVADGFTVSMWVKTEGIDSLLELNGKDFTFALGANLTATLTRAEGQTSTLPAQSGLPAGEWACVTATVSRSGIAVYLNGVQVSSAEENLAGLFTRGSLSQLQLCIGAGTGAAVIDDVAIYGTALAAAEVNALIDPNIAWQTGWQIDFGPENSPLWAGFTPMSNETLYNKVGLLQGYGFDRVINAGETVDGGNKIRDFVYAVGGAEYTFKMDLPNGTYRVFVYTGAKNAINTVNFSFQNDPTVYTQVTPEGVASDNYGGPNTYTVTVTNQLLTIKFWGDTSLGEDAITGRLNSLEITKIG